MLGVANAWTIWADQLDKETYVHLLVDVIYLIEYGLKQMLLLEIQLLDVTSCRRRESAPLTRIFPGRDSQLRDSSTSFGTTEKKNKKQEKNTIRKDISLAPSTLHQFEKVCVHVGIICKYFVLEKE